MDNRHKLVDQLLVQSEAISSFFTGDENQVIDTWKLNKDGVALDFAESELYLKLISPTSESVMQLWLCETKSSEVIIPIHAHPNIEYLYLLDGKMDSISNDKYSLDNDHNYVKIESYREHGFKVYPHTRFFVIFHPAVKIIVEESA